MPGIFFSGRRWVNGSVNLGSGGGVPKPGPSLFKNQLPKLLASEMEAAAEVGAVPIKIGSAAFEAAANSGTVKFVVTQSGEILVVPHTVGGVEISHAVLSRGQAVLAAGQADIAVGGGQSIVISMTTHSGHFMNGASAEANAVALSRATEAFKNAGFTFPPSQ